MKIIMSKRYLDIARNHFLPVSLVKTHEGIMTVEENECREIVISINDLWGFKVFDSILKTGIAVIGSSISIFQHITDLESNLEYTCERYRKHVVIPDNRKAA